MTELKEQKPTLAEIQAMPVHPIAAMFPMLAEDELAELAADIAENGVNHPVVITRGGVLVDGRNRLAACALVKVEPPVTYFDGGDPAAFIISENVNRRHLSKSQRAMAVAKAFPTPQQGKKSEASSATEQVARVTLSNARTIIRLAPDLVDQVLAGSLTVDLAYKQALLRKSESDRRLDRIRAIGRSNPEFAESVSNGALTIDEAEAKIKEAEKEHKQLRWAATKNLVDAVMIMNRPCEVATEIAALFDPAVAENSGQVINSEKLRQVSAYAAALADAFASIEDSAA